MRLAGIALLLLFASWNHPIHVSVTNIDLDPDVGKMELSVKIFADDFQDLILHKYSVQLKLMDKELPGDKIIFVNRYIGETLKIEINGKEIEKFKFEKSELNEEAIWLHYSYDHGSGIRKINVRNILMNEKFDDQTNLLIISYNGTQNGYRMDNKTTDLTFNIK
jgi:hypothetical protein